MVKRTCFPIFRFHFNSNPAPASSLLPCWLPWPSWAFPATKPGAEAPDHPSRIATKKVSSRTGQALGIDLSSRSRSWAFFKDGFELIGIHWHSLVMIAWIALFFAFRSFPLEWLGIAMENRSLLYWEDLRFATSRAVSRIWAFPAPLVLRSAPCADSLVLGRFITTFTLVKLTHQSSTKQQKHLLNAALSKGQFWCPESFFFFFN